MTVSIVTAIPSARTKNTTQNQTVMGVIGGQKHLNPPVLVAAPVHRRVAMPTQKKRCLRCGLHKSGIHHKGKAKKDSQEYCSVPESKRWPGWIVQQGYGVGDTRKAEALRTAQRDWRRYRAEHMIDEHPDFVNW